MADGWMSMHNAPRDGRWILGLYDDGKMVIRWADRRRCVLATVAPGAGEFGPGWEDQENGLPVDPPHAWSDCPAAEAKSGEEKS